MSLPRCSIIFRFPARIFAAGILALATARAPWAASPPNPPVTAPGFQLTDPLIWVAGPDGFKAWDMEVHKADNHSADSGEIAVTDLKLHLYSGGSDQALETTISSPTATVLETGIARGADSLLIAGSSYIVTGSDWSWDGKKHLIIVRRNVHVTFDSAASTPVQSAGAPGAPAHAVTITSDSLEIHQDQPGHNRFVFTGNVDVNDGESDTRSGALEVLAVRAMAAGATVTNADGGKTPVPASLGVGRIEYTTASDHVVVNQGNLVATGGAAKLVPNDQSVTLSESPTLHDKASDTLIEGGVINWFRDRQKFTVEPRILETNSPPQVRVSFPALSSYQQGAAGTVAGDPTGQRMVISGETLNAQLGATERRIDVERSVHITDPSLSVDANHLDAEFDAAPTDTSDSLQLPAVGASPQIGRLTHLLAEGAVVINQPDRHTTAQQAEILPALGKVVLNGAPQVDDLRSNAVIGGNQISLFTGSQDAKRVEVASAPGQPATLTLPALPGTHAIAGDAAVKTKITSEAIAMVRETEYTTFDFEGNVTVVAGDLGVTSGSLEAQARNASTSGGAGPAGSGQVGDILHIQANHHVVIKQGDYEAHAATADIYPQTQVTPDAPTGATASPQDYRFAALQGDPAGLDGPVRPEVVLPAIQDLGWDVAPANTAATVEPAKPTVITSDKQELFTSPNGNVYWFTGHVKIEGGSLQGVCDNMKVEASPQQAAGTGAPGAASPSAIKSIVAAGFVRITQGTRVATAGQAKILPSEGKIILTDHPTVDDGGNGAHADGGVIELDRNDRDAHVSGAPGAPDSPPVRPRFSLPLNNIDNPLKSSDKTSTKNSP